MAHTNMPVSAGSGDHRWVGFTDAIKLFFYNYTNFRGRSSRSAFWFWALAGFIINIINFVLNLVDRMVFGGFSGEAVGILSGIWGLATLIPSIALAVRRLHDIDRTGWWLLLVFTGIGVILLLIWDCLLGTQGENRFGPDIEAGKEKLA